jgi:hypothetical protein
MEKHTDEPLLRRLHDNPDQHFDGIVTVDGDPAEYAAQVEALNLTVKQTFVLTRKLALSGAARAFITLNEKDWVLKLEEDRPIKAMNHGPTS